MSAPLWEPSPERKAEANLTAFMESLRHDRGLSVEGYGDLYAWSCNAIEPFWESMWDFCGVIAETRGATTLRDPTAMPGAQFFPDARLNFAENLLRRRDSRDAIVFWGEDRVQRRTSFEELYDEVSRLTQALAALGVGQGDRVAGYLPNMPEAVVAMLASAALGAVWTSCSPDFGVQGVLDRFGQIEPKVVFGADGYYYKGKPFGVLDRISEFARELPTLQAVVVVEYVAEEPDTAGLENSLREHGTQPSPPRVGTFTRLVAEQPGGEIEFRQVPFNHPIYIMYSSGTTGKPKCMVHGVGGTLLKHLCEHQLMCDVKPDDRVFYFTTCGWMMWNWLVSALASEATLLLYDGNPFAPGPEILFDFADAEKMTLFGTSAKYLDSLKNAGLDPKSSHQLGPLRTLTSTGSPLAPESFEYVYEHIKKDLCLSSIAGGTDLIGCFVGGNPIGPVWSGEIQARVLGMAVDVFDEEGHSVREEKGELVCTKPWPSMPVYFWNDPDGARYRAAYFDRYPGVWWHGDFVELTEHDGIIMHGRSDATLNPGGVRIGTSEIYRQVEQLEEVEEALAVGQDWQGDVRVILFVKLHEGLELTEDLIDRIRRDIRSGCSPRHVPAKVLRVTDIPRTKSGKIVEMAVREVIHGRPVKNVEALANPAALDQFKGRAELED
jgi:acetoacetyl-CoA synthetase